VQKAFFRTRADNLSVLYEHPRLLTPAVGFKHCPAITPLIPQLVGESTHPTALVLQGPGVTGSNWRSCSNGEKFDGIFLADVLGVLEFTAAVLTPPYGNAHKVRE